MTALIVLFVLVAVTLVGASLLPSPGEKPATALGSLVAGAALGLVLLGLSLTALDAAGVAWSRPLLLALLAGGAAIAGRRGVARLRSASSPLPIGWGDLVAFAGIVVVAVAAHSGWTVSIDFVDHWGVKGAKIFVARGVDWRFLASPWLATSLHPDYPLLLPELYATTALLRGLWLDSAGLLWTPCWAALLLVAGRDWLDRQVTDRFLRQATLAFLGLFLAFSTLALRRAGDSDWVIALVILAAAAWLSEAATPDHDLPLGALAALAASSKIEGVPLALFLIVVHATRRLRRAGWRGSLGFWRSALPPLAAILPWAWNVARHGLLSPENHGPLRLDHLGPVLAAMLASAAQPAWRGFGLATLLALPLLFTVPRLRPVGTLILLQLGFYLYAYLSSPVDAVTLAETSFLRLLGHFAPTIFVGAAAAGAALERRGQGDRPPRPLVASPSSVE